MTTPQQSPSKNSAPILPPDEEFWEKYSPHYEFPLSSVGSIALHVAGLMIFLGALYMLSKMTIPDTGPVPMREMSVMGDGDNANGTEGSGFSPVENVTPIEKPVDTSREVPEKVLNDVIADIKEYLPVIPQDPDAPNVKDLPPLQKFAKLDEEIRKKLIPGGPKNKGAGNNEGKNDNNQPGAGSGGKDGDPTSSFKRGARWVLIFKTENSVDYLNQLGAMKATIVVPQPPDFKKVNLAYRNPNSPNPKGEPIDVSNIPGLFFIDDEGASASRVARSLGLNFDPPLFIAFFPKDVEEQLAAEERRYRGRREDQILSTTFKILIRDGRYTVQVTEQQAVKR